MNSKHFIFLMIKGILFDVGGVLVTGNIETFFTKVSPVIHMHMGHLKYEPTSMVPDFAKGKMDARICFEMLFKQKFDDKTYNKILEIFTTNWQPYPPMLELVKKIKATGKYKLGVLSNSDPLNSPIFRSKGLYDLFDAVTLSHEVGYAKPEPEIYKIALKKLGIPKKETIFIDDLMPCIEGAKKIGLNGIQFKNKEQLIEDLKLRGITL